MFIEHSLYAGVARGFVLIVSFNPLTHFADEETGMGRLVARPVSDKARVQTQGT